MRLAGGGGDKESGRWMGHDEPLKRVYCYTPFQCVDFLHFWQEAG